MEVSIMRMFRKLTSLKLFDVSVVSSRVEIVGVIFQGRGDLAIDILKV